MGKRLSRAIDAVLSTGRAGAAYGTGAAIGGHESGRTTANVSELRYRSKYTVDGEPAHCMLICPQCDTSYFYDDCIEECPDCGVELVEQ